MINLCYQRGISVWQQSPVNALAANHIHFSLVFPALGKGFLHTVNQNGAFYLLTVIPRNHNIYSFFHRLALGKAL